MSQCLHCVALTDEVSDGMIVILIDFEQFDSHCAFAPSSLIDYAISALGDLFPECQLFERNLHGSVEGTRVQ
jgi:hypothetical protein